MKTQLIKFPINNELDIILVHRRANQLCEFSGISISDKTRFATAISEICRNCLEYARTGDVEFMIEENNGKYCIEAIIEDKGRGIKNIDEILNKTLVISNGRGVGILHSKKLVDIFDIQTSPKGTKVSLGMQVPAKHPPISDLIIKGWIQNFNKNIAVSPYEEIRKQNIQLLEITEQLKLKNLEAETQIHEINELNKQLKSANQELEDFTYTVSHDLKSPISNLEGLIFILKKKKEGEKDPQLLQLIEISVQKLKRTIHLLVEILETQNTENELLIDVSFNDIFKTIKDQYSNEIKDSGALVKGNFKYKNIKYFEAYLRSIIQNLMNNSIKYRNPGRVLTLNVSSKREGEYCLLQIKDNGIGMDMDKVGKKLFKPFTRFNNKTEGNGIGLHIVKNMVEKNGGKIEVESEEGVGTTFNIFLKEY